MWSTCGSSGTGSSCEGTGGGATLECFLRGTLECFLWVALVWFLHGLYSAWLCLVGWSDVVSNYAKQNKRCM